MEKFQTKIADWILIINISASSTGNVTVVELIREILRKMLESVLHHQTELSSITVIV